MTRRCPSVLISGAVVDVPAFHVVPAAAAARVVGAGARASREDVLQEKRAHGHSEDRPHDLLDVDTHHVRPCLRVCVNVRAASHEPLEEHEEQHEREDDIRIEK